MYNAIALSSNDQTTGLETFINSPAETFRRVQPSERGLAPFSFPGSDPNGARITQAFGSLELAANLAVSLFYASIYCLPSLDSLFCFSTGYREQMIGLRAALDGTRFIAVRSVTYPLLNDQVQ